MPPPLSAQPVDGLPSVEALSPGLLKNVMSPLWWDAEAHVLEMVDQTVLPETYRTVVIDSAQATFDAIKTMVVRGAPAIGLAGAYGLVLASKAALDLPLEAYVTHLHEAADMLVKARPTAVNLAWALAEQRQLLDRLVASAQDDDTDLAPMVIHAALLHHARWLHLDDIERCKAIGVHGQKLVPKQGAGILTHCNAGALATGGYGTALGVIRKAVELDPTIKVYADETRPRLQGATLTAWELARDEIDVTLIADTMSAWAMQQGKIDMVVVGADRIAANGDAANKIG
ncbi:MAG: S-methyl-5-thioribose-1-phosphate isomerase, partial [Cyanobacteria bacterium HKST-UBA05]|nr:S-methyl-5-thioribose-1-phosphate isomerase [Cyanobacteria bacterium HKST-UBA05]